MRVKAKNPHLQSVVDTGKSKPIAASFAKFGTLVLAHLLSTNETLIDGQTSS